MKWPVPSGTRLLCPIPFLGNMPGALAMLDPTDARFTPDEHKLVELEGRHFYRFQLSACEVDELHPVRSPIKGAREGWSSGLGSGKAHYFPEDMNLSACPKRWRAPSSLRFAMGEGDSYGCSDCRRFVRRQTREGAGPLFAAAPRAPRSARPVVLIGCSSRKLSRSSPARELYASDLFRKSVRYAEGRGWPFAILSALHGLVLPDQVLDPYDFKASKLRGDALRSWGLAVSQRLEDTFPRATFVLLAGSLYRAAVEPLGTDRFSDPLKGLEIGERLQWLKREIAQGAAA